MNDLSDKIKFFRCRLGISQADLARILGISSGTVKNWEQGRTQPMGLARNALIQFIASTEGEYYQKGVDNG